MCIHVAIVIVRHVHMYNIATHPQIIYEALVSITCFYMYMYM